MSLLSAGNPEPKARGNIVQDQSRPPQRTLTSLLTIAAMSASLPPTPPSYTITNEVFKIRKKIMSQQEEMKIWAYWGNKETNYIFDYQPRLESFDIVMWKMTISSNLTVLNLPHCPITAQPDFLRPFIFPIIPDKLVSSQNPSNSTSLAIEITEIFTKTVSLS